MAKRTSHPLGTGATSFGGKLPGASQNVDALYQRLLDEGHHVQKLNDQMIRITQQLSSREVTTDIRLGQYGGTFLSNPDRPGGERPVQSLVSLNRRGGMDIMDPHDRISHWLQNPHWNTPSGREREAGLMSMAGHGMDPGLNWIRRTAFENHPAFERAVGEGYSHNYKQTSKEFGRLTDLLGDDYVAYSGSSSFYRAESLMATGPTASFPGDDRGDVSLLDKLKRLKTGMSNSSLMGRVGAGLAPRGLDPFFIEGSLPGFGSVANVMRTVAFPGAEGSAFSAGMTASNAMPMRMSFAPGTTYDPTTGQFVMPGGEKLTQNTFYGRDRANIDPDASRAGSLRELRQILGRGAPSGSYEAMNIQGFSDIRYDRSGNPLSAMVNLMGSTSESLAHKELGRKEELFQITRKGMQDYTGRNDIDIFGAFPTKEQLPAWALSVIKAETNNTTGFEAWFRSAATAEGKNTAWINKHWQDGQLSREGAGVVAGRAIDQAMQRMEIFHFKDQPTTAADLEGLQGRTFFHQGAEHPYLENIRAGANGVTIADWNTPGWIGREKVNVGTEFAKETSRLSPGTLNVMAQYYPQLYRAMAAQGEAGLGRNRAYNLIASYRANFSEAQSQQVEKVFGIKDVDPARVAQIQEAAITANPKISAEDLRYEIALGLKKEYGSASLRTQTPQGPMTLPNASALRSSMTAGVSNWASSTVDLLRSGGAPEEERRDLASLVFRQLGEASERRSTVKQALSISMGRAGGIATAAAEVPDDTTIFSARNLMKLSGIKDPKEMYRQIDAGELTGTSIRYPFANAENQFVTGKLDTWERQNEAFRRKFRNPGSGTIVSPLTMMVLQGDTDADRVQTMLNYMTNQKGVRTGGPTTLMSPGEMLRRVKMAGESEYTKRVEAMQALGGFDTRGQNPMNRLGGFALKQMGKLFFDEEIQARGQIGKVYNSIMRTMGGVVNRGNEIRYGADDPFTRHVASAMGKLNETASQTLLDRMASGDTNLGQLIEAAWTGSRSVNRQGQGGAYYMGSTTQYAGTDEEFWSKIFKASSRIGYNISGKGFINPVTGKDDPNIAYRETLAPQVATLLMNPITAQGLIKQGGGEFETRIQEVANVLSEQQQTGGKTDRSADLLRLTGYDPDAINPFTAWGTGNKTTGSRGMSGIAQWISGSLAWKDFRKHGQKSFSAWVTPWQQKLGMLVGESTEMTNLEKGGVKGPGGPGAPGGGSPLDRDRRRGMFPADPGEETRQAEVTKNFSRAFGADALAQMLGRDDLYVRGRSIAASGWYASGDPAQRELIRLTALNTNSSNRDEVMANLKKMGLLPDWEPFGGAGKKAAAQGTAMHALLPDILAPKPGLMPIGSLYETEISNPERRVNKSRVDAVLNMGKDAAGNDISIVADLKTHGQTGVEALRGQTVDPKVAAQMGIYDETLRKQGLITGDYGAILTGVLDPSQDPNKITEVETAQSLEKGYDIMMAHFSGPMPSDWTDKDKWNKVSQGSIDIMNTIFNVTGRKVGARMVTGEEMREAVAGGQDNLQGLLAINPEILSKMNPEEIAHVVASMAGGGNLQDAAKALGRFARKGSPAMNAAAGGGGVGKSGGSTSTTATGGDGGDGGGGDGGKVSILSRLSMPSISPQQVGEAVAAFEELGDVLSDVTKVASGLTDQSKEVRKAWQGNIDALSKATGFLDQMDWMRGKMAGEGLEPPGVGPQERVLKAALGSNIAAIGQTVGNDTVAMARMRSTVMDIQGVGAEQPGGNGMVGKFFDRLIKGQGLFHAKLAFNMLARPVLDAAQDYQAYEAGIGSMQYQTGQINYSQLMAGSYGTITRRQATQQQAMLAFGQQALAAYGPAVNAVLTPEMTQGPLGALAAIGLPAAGLGVAATSLLGSTPAGWLVAGGVAAAGVLGYADTAKNSQDAIIQVERGRALANAPNQTFQGQVGAGLNTNSLPANWIQIGGPSLWDQLFQKPGASGFIIDKNTGQKINPYQQMTDLFQEGLRASAQNQTDFTQFGAMTALINGASLAQVAQQFPAADLQGAQTAALNDRIKQTGLAEGLAPEEAVKTMGDWMMYHDQIPTLAQTTQLRAVHAAGISVTPLAIARAEAHGISPFNRTAIGFLQQDALGDLIAANQSGRSIPQTEEQLRLANQAIAEANQMGRMSGGGKEIQDTDYATWSAMGADTASAMTQGRLMQNMVAYSNPTYASNYAQAFDRIDAVRQDLTNPKRFIEAHIMEQQVVSGSELSTQMGMYGVGEFAQRQMITRYQGVKDIASQTKLNQALAGNPQVLSRMGQQAGVPGMMTLNPQTGMGIYYQNIPQMNMDYLRQNDPYAMMTNPDGSQATDDQLRGGTREWQRNITLAQRQQQTLQYNAGVQSRDLNWNLMTGNLGAVQKSLATGDPAKGQVNMGFQVGNGMGYWQLEDANRALNRDQQRFGFRQETAMLGIQERQFALQGQQFEANWNLNMAQFQGSTAYQRQEMTIGRQHQVQQQNWQLQDMAFSRSQLDIGFAWQMEDYGRNIRYARGREKRDLIREEGRAVVQYSMTAGHMDTQEQRARTQIKWDEEEFNRRKQYFEQTVKWHDEELRNQKRFFDEGRKLDRERMDLQIQAHNRQLFYMQQTWQLEDQRIMLDRQNASFQYNQAVMMDEKIRGINLQMNSWVDWIDQAGISINLANGYLSTFAGLIQMIINALSGSNTPAPGSSGHSPTPGSPQLPNPGGTQPRVGDTKTINGQPYSWDGTRWAPLPSPGVGIGPGGNQIVSSSYHSSAKGVQSDEATDWLKVIASAVQQMAQNPVNFQAVFNGLATTAEPIPLGQQNLARVK